MPDEVKLEPCQNTDRELWREDEGDYYAPSVHVTKEGAVGINVGGDVIVRTLREWHRAAIEATRPTAVVKELVEALEDVLNPIGRLRRLAEAEGTQLGPMAYSIANDIGYIRSIAREALARTGVTLNG